MRQFGTLGPIGRYWPSPWDIAYCITDESGDQEWRMEQEIRQALQPLMRKALERPLAEKHLTPKDI